MANKEEIVIMTKKELDDLVYYSSLRAASKACSNLYHGLCNAFLDRFDKDLENIIEAIDYIKLRYKSDMTENDKVAPIKKETSSPVSNFFNNMTDEQKEAIKKSINQTLKMNQLIQTPNVNYPKFNEE